MADKKPNTKAQGSNRVARSAMAPQPAPPVTRVTPARPAPAPSAVKASPATKPSGAKGSGSGSKFDQVRAAAGAAVAKAKKSAKKAGDAAAGKGKVIAATAGVVAATAAGVAAVRAFKGRKGSGNGRVYHVQPQGEDWQVMLEGNERASGTYGTKKQAITAGRTLAQKHEPSRLIIHGGDGTIQRSHSYSDD